MYLCNLDVGTASMTVAFVINNRNKGQHVYKAVRGALSQTFPCEIIISDQGSTDNSLDEIDRAIKECPRGAEHNVRVVHCPITGPTGMEMGNAHFFWAWQQASPEVDFVYQCSADDVSLPDRVAYCEAARSINPADAVATTMYFVKPEQLDDALSEKEIQLPVSGFPQQSGYLHAGEGLQRLAYGSVIAGYSRKFLESVDSGGKNTIDVLYGYLAALKNGFYVVAQPSHLHVEHSGKENMGYGGKLRDETISHDERLQLNELNQAQLFRLYRSCLGYGQQMFPEGIPQEHLVPLLNMMIGHSIGWLTEREKLSEFDVVPGKL